MRFFNLPSKNVSRLTGRGGPGPAKNLRLMMFAACLGAGLFWPLRGRAEYHNFNTAGGAGSDIVMQEVRWPVWPCGEYNAIYENHLLGLNGTSVGEYGGMPIDSNGVPPISIIWSFWTPSGVSDPGAAVTAYWTATNMYAPLHEGEGASGKVGGDWPLLTTNRWYREVMRIWPPVDGTPNTGYAARWIRDSATTNWYHIATMKLPFTPTGLAGLAGFQEALGSEVGPRRTDYRNAYCHPYGGTNWQTANQFTCSTRTMPQIATAGLIENATAVFFEMGDVADTNYFYRVISNPPPVTGPLYLMISTNYPSGSLLTNGLPAGMLALGPSPVGVTLTLTNQPAAPALDPLVVTNPAAVVAGTQLLVSWQVPPASSPQFSYQVDVFNNSNYTGTAALTVFDIDPEARQKLLDITGVSTPYVRLTVADVMNQTNGPILLTPAAAVLSSATNVTGLVPGLAYKYYESTTNFNAMPNFNTLTPVYVGGVDYPDLTLRRQRQQYAFNYTGYLNVPTSGLYAFTLNSSDGSRLYLDGNPVVNWDGEHSAADKNGWAGLSAGLHVVNVQYFFDTDNPNAHDLTDTLTVSWAGPGLSQTIVPATAWYRQPVTGEPGVALTSPVAGSTIGGTNVPLAAAVTNNGATINKTEYYVGGYYWGSDATVPYGLNALFWANPSNAIRARVFYNGTNTVDSAASVVGTTNMNLTPWNLAPIGDHLESVGAQVQGSSYTLAGDGLNLLSQPVSGDCTIVGHVASLGALAGTSPDGQTPDSSWEGGIMLRQNTNATPGRALGDSSAQYACVFAQVGGGSHFEDYTMANAGGPYASPNLGSYAWFKIQRIGDLFTSYVSADGTNWSAVNTNTLTGIGTVLNVGLFTYDASSANPNVFAAGFDNVGITGDILSPPTVAVTPAATNVYQGQSATFTAVPGGNAPFTYQWQDNGTTLPGATNATLTVTNLQPGNSGLYQVQLTTTNGTAGAVGTLTVQTPPNPGISSYAGRVQTNSALVAYWRLNETNGTIAADTLGGHNGTYSNVGLGTNGPQPPAFAGFEATNYAGQFNGSNSYVGAGSLGLTGPLTITAWIKPGAISGKQAIASENGSYYFKLDGANLDFYTNTSSGLSVPVSLTAGVWQQVAVTYVPGTTGGGIFYVNGQPVGSANTAPLTRGTSGFWIGKNTWTAQYFSGAIDEVAVFNQALSATELQNQYQAALTSPSAVVTLTSPASGAAYLSPATISLAATADTNDYAVSRVQFYNGLTLLGQVTNPPYNFAWTNVAAGQYTVYAEAVYGGTNVMSSVPAFISVASLPSVPAGLTATPGGWEVALTWQAASNAVSYDVARSVTSGGPYETIASVTATNYLDGAGPPVYDPTDYFVGDGAVMYGTTYYYVVAAVNNAGQSTNSAEVSAEPVNTPLSDAYVYGGSQGSNYGTDTNLMVKLSGTSYTRETYLMFDVSALAGAESVILQLMPVSVTGSPTLGFEFISDDTWTELGINWTNRPAGTGIVFTNMSGFTVGVPVSVDVTSEAVSQAGQDGLLSVHVYSTLSGSTAVNFGSKELPAVTNQPQLIATFPPPPPIFTGGSMVSNGPLTLCGTGHAGSVYVLQMATNLSPSSVWTPVATNMTSAEGLFQFVDLHATNASRFYRLKTR